MAHYLVSARFTGDKNQLQNELDSGSVKRMLPFGRSLHHSLTHARVDPESGRAVWEELDFCSPPLAQERKAVLDRYFDEIETERVGSGIGWAQIEDLPSFWGDSE